MSDPRIVSSQDSLVIPRQETIAPARRKSYTSPARMDSDNAYLLESLDVKICQIPGISLKQKEKQPCLHPFPSASVGVRAKRDLGDVLIQSSSLQTRSWGSVWPSDLSEHTQ